MDAPGSDGGTPIAPDGGVLAGPIFDPGYVACGQSTLGDTDLQTACNAMMGGTPNPPPSTPRQCTALTGSVDVAVGCKESACQGHQCIDAEIWVRVTARSTGSWSFSPGSEIDVGLDDSYLINRCWSQTQTPGGLVNDDDPGGMCGTGWTGQPYFLTSAESTMARMFAVPGGTYTASGQMVSGTVWFPLDEAAPAPSTTVDAAFPLAVPFTATLP
jgi:hypothetical protein